MTDLIDEAPDALDARRLAFDEEQKSCVTSTDIPKILGLTRYGSALTVYIRKVGEAREYQSTLPAWIGQRLENLVAELYVAATDIRVRADNRLLRHPEYPWLGTHLDRRAVGDPGLLVELKTRSSRRGWGDDGSDVIPPDVWTQVQFQMWVTGAARTHVAVLFSNNDYRTYAIKPNPEFWEKLFPTVHDFWFNNVLALVPPAPTGADTDSAIVKELTGGGGLGNYLKAATPEQEQLVAEFRLARLNAAQAAFIEEGLKNRVRLVIGEEADGLRGRFGVIWYKRVRDSHKVAWGTVAQVYRSAALKALALVTAEPGGPPLAITVDDIRLALDTAEDLYTTTEPGTRRVTVAFEED